MKKKGFGKSQPSIKEAKKFILAFYDCGVKNKGDKAKYEEFLKANLDKLDESLLEALPLVFRDLTANKLSQERENFASVFGNFALLIKDFSLNDKSLNQELSIVAFKLILKIWSWQEFPEYWAIIQHNLGVTYSERIKGAWAENLESAIACYQEALNVYTFTAFPEDWAMTQNNLGNAYSDRIRGERAENLETAITSYQEALKFYTFNAFPQSWAGTQNNLGLAYQNRIRGERADNLETAIAYYQEALKVRIFDAFPEDWAMIQMNLGTAYSNRIRGEQAENLEAAITFYQETLNVYTFEAFPQGWADTQICLGNTYQARIRGERADNLETAIAFYQEALKVFNFNDFPKEWATTEMNLGSAYSDRIRGKRTENLEAAIACYQEAFKVYTFDAFPQDWAATQGNLARVLTERSSLNYNAQDLDQGIELYQQALTVSAAGSDYFINHQYGLGNALARRYETSKNLDDLQQSLAAYQIALNYLSPEHYDRQQFWQAIPATQAILGSRLVRDGNWQEGLKLLINSLNQLKTGDNSLVYANTLYQTGYAYELLSDQENARLYYRDALRLYEHLQDLPGIAKSRESLGNVFVSQGHLEKGMSELAQAREIYQQLGKTEAAEKVDNTYQSVQQVLEQVKSEVLA
jgi:tetratricopeptide (TPR) repeat protein